MKSFRVLMIAAALALFTASLAAAHSVTPRVDRRQAQQRVRIVQGVRSGELTRGELRHLRAGQAHVRRMERRAKADGVVTPGERVRLARAQARQSRHIARFKHNGRVA